MGGQKNLAGYRWFESISLQRRVCEPRSPSAADVARCPTANAETHDHSYVGHFHLRLTNFTRTCLAFEIARKRNTYVEVSCSLDAVEFKEVQRIVNIIFDQHG
jgi:hypothetical protein